MSRLMADQESCGGKGEPGAGEEDSVMRVNLAEGCRAVNGETRLVSLVDLVYLVSVVERNYPDRPGSPSP